MRPLRPARLQNNYRTKQNNYNNYNKNTEQTEDAAAIHDAAIHDAIDWPIRLCNVKTELQGEDRVNKSVLRVVGKMNPTEEEYIMSPIPVTNRYSDAVPIFKQSIKHKALPYWKARFYVSEEVGHSKKVTH